MGIFASLRNAVRWAGVDLGRPDGAAAQAVVIVSSETGEAASSASPLHTDPLGQPGEARQLAITTTSASVALTEGVRRISIKARGCDMRYVVGVGAQTANAATSHLHRSSVSAWTSPCLLVRPLAAIRETAATADGSPGHHRAGVTCSCAPHD